MKSIYLHIGDLNNATRHLTRLERSIYIDLILHYYDTEMPLQCECNANALPTQCDHHALAKRVLVKGPEEVAAMHSVLDEFFILEEDGWHNPRCDAELEKVYKKSIKAKASAEKRWAKHNKKKKRNANALPTQCETDATHNPKPITESPPLAASNFVAPTLEEVTTIASMRGYRIDPEAFFLHYQSMGWTVKGSPMQDWQARLAVWAKEDANRAQAKSDGKPRSTGDKNSTRKRSLVDDLTDTTWAE